MIKVVAAPFDGGGAMLGSRLGPAAIRIAGLEESLARLGIPVADWFSLQEPELQESHGGIRHFKPLLGLLKGIHQEVARSLTDGQLPIVLGGEHSVSMGSISAAVEHFGAEEIAVIWIDAHADINTPDDSSSGNLHGMPLAALCGFESGGEEQVQSDWNSLLSFTSKGRLDIDHVAWLGLRDVDSTEAARLKSRGSFVSTMFDSDTEGLVRQIGLLHNWLLKTGVRHVWVSFDVDSLDPILAPGTGTAVRGGFTYREAHLIAELFHKRFSDPDIPYSLAGVDVVETNPLMDVHNVTAKMAVEWVASLLGKTILGGNGR